MASSSIQNTKTNDSASGGQSTSSIGSPITNEAYDVLTALQSKLEGLEAYRKYARSGNTELWQSLTRADVESVNRLVSSLEQLVRDGKLRSKEPGKADA